MLRLLLPLTLTIYLTLSHSQKVISGSVMLVVFLSTVILEQWVALHISALFIHPVRFLATHSSLPIVFGIEI